MIKLDYRSRTPIYRQLEESIMELVVVGAYPKDMQLPSVRTLAVELGINPNTIQKAYQELESMEVIYSVTGKGSFIQGVSSAQQHIRVKSTASLEVAVREARLAGVSQQEAIQVVNQEYIVETTGKEGDSQ
ncbi:MAG: GntR family transcriptional regulator [Angelakisella sp.]